MNIYGKRHDLEKDDEDDEEDSPFFFITLKIHSYLTYLYQNKSEII